MNIFVGYVAVFMGAGLGGALRHTINRAAFAWLGAEAHWATMWINVSGSLILGLLAGWFAFRAQESDQLLRLLITTGFLGGYTTFSTFSLETVLLWERGQFGLAAVYVTASVALSVAAALGGLALVRAAT